nr:isoform 4 of sh3 domain-containing ysc84-like protein 1 [Quercus suber]
MVGLRADVGSSHSLTRAVSGLSQFTVRCFHDFMPTSSKQQPEVSFTGLNLLRFFPSNFTPLFLIFSPLRIIHSAVEANLLCVFNMKSVKRVFGVVGKTTEDQADIGAVLAEFKAIDTMLSSLVKDLKDWRNNWEDVLQLQYDTSEAFANLYRAIEPTSDPEMRHQPVPTPDRYIQKCLGLQKCTSNLRDDLKQEINMIDAKLVRPAEEAKAQTKGLQKTIKHRENMKRDYERYLGRAEHARKKENRSMKEEASLAKCEGELVQAQIDFETADDQIRQHIPPVTAAVISLMPFLLANQVTLQTTLVGQLYTILDEYCRKHRLPSPAPSDEQIIRVWNEEFSGFRKELEGGIVTIAQGKAVQRSMTIADKDKSTLTGLGIRNKASAYNPIGRKTSQNVVPQRLAIGAGTPPSSHLVTVENDEDAPSQPPRPNAVSPYRVPDASPGIPLSSKPRMPSSGYSQPTHIAPYDQKSTATIPSWADERTLNGQPPSYDQSNGSATPSSHYQTPVSSPYASTLSVNSGDYFAGERHASHSSLASAAANAVVGKKKPPPPVPAKRFPSGQNVQWVTAIYDFEGQGGDDLTFREGDQIRVVKKTESTDDWWTGELRGKTGSFPANYIRL